MKTRLLFAVLLATLALAGTMAGCGRSKETAAPQENSKATTQSEKKTAQAALGSEKQAGPFAVTLSTSPETPKAGKVTFIVKATENGQPVKDAKVAVDLSMPGMSESRVELIPSGDTYEGTGDFAMAGEWQAKVDISSGKGSGSATFTLKVTQ